MDTPDLSCERDSHFSAKSRKRHFQSKWKSAVFLGLVWHCNGRKTLKNKKFGARPPNKKQILFHSLATVAILLAASLLCELLCRLEFGEQNINIVVVLAVFMVAAITDGYLYGLFAALSVFIYDFLVTTPRFGFSFTKGFPVTLAIMLLVTLTTSTITARMKKHTKRARYQEQRAEMLYDINRKLLSCRDEASIARYVMEYLKDGLRRSIALYTSLDDAEHPSCYFRQAEGDITSDYFISEAGWNAATLAARQKKPQADAVACYVPIIAQETVYGVLGISCLFGTISSSNQAFLTLMVEQAPWLFVFILWQYTSGRLSSWQRPKNPNSFLREFPRSAHSLPALSEPVQLLENWENPSHQTIWWRAFTRFPMFAEYGRKCSLRHKNS